MSDLPRVCICLLTYQRYEYAVRTIRSAIENITYEGELAVHIADDGSEPPYRKDLFDFVGGFEGLATVTCSDAQRAGYGGNFNLAMQTMHSEAEIILPLEDDWELARPLDLTPLVKTLLDANGIQCIRMGYLGWTAELRGKLVASNGSQYLLFDHESPEHHVFSGHPRLETVEFEKNVGPWPKGLEAGQTERVVSNYGEARQGVAWPLDLLPPRGDLFLHIGTVESVSPE